MKKKLLGLSLIYLTLIIVGTFHITFSFFSDSGTSTANVFAAATLFPTPTHTIAQTLVINELLPLSSCNSGQTNGQYLELWNGSGGAVDLQQFKLSDGTNTIAIANSNTSLPIGSFAILVKSEGVINQCLGSNVNGAITVNLGGQIDLNTGLLRLLDANDVVIDTIQWGNGQTLQPATDQSIERVPTGKDSALGISFNASDMIVKEVPTVGFGTTLLLNEFIPNSATEQVEIFNPTGTTINLTGWTLEDAIPTAKSLTALGSIAFNTFVVRNEPSGWLNNTGPETLRLKDPSGRIVDSHTYTGSIGAGLSIGRLTNGASGWKQTCTATTIGSSNNGSC